MTKTPKKPGVSDTERAPFSADAPKAAGRTLKVRRVGNSLGVVLPKEVLAKLRVAEGDELTVTNTAEGVALQPSADEAAELMRLAEDIMRRRRKVLKVLAQ